MGNQLGWFGYSNKVRSLVTMTEEELGKKFDTFEDAMEGLRGITDNDYEAIVFNTATPVGDLLLPTNRKVYLGDWTTTDCYVIDIVRQTRPKTPIILTHIGSFPGKKLESALKEYREAGITEDVHLWIDKNNNSLVSTLRRTFIS